MTTARRPQFANPVARVASNCAIGLCHRARVHCQQDVTRWMARTELSAEDCGCAAEFGHRFCACLVAEGVTVAEGPSATLRVNQTRRSATFVGVTAERVGRTVDSSIYMQHTQRGLSILSDRVEFNSRWSSSIRHI